MARTPCCAAERPGDLADLPADALGPVGRADVGPLECRQLSALRVADAKLQFRAADFDAQEHVGSVYGSSCRPVRGGMCP